MCFMEVLESKRKFRSNLKKLLSDIFRDIAFTRMGWTYCMYGQKTPKHNACGHGYRRRRGIMNGIVSPDYTVVLRNIIFSEDKATEMFKTIS